MTYEQAVARFKADFDNIGLTIANKMVIELVAEGHKATGQLMKSVARETTVLLNVIQTEISYYDYGRAVNTGVAANRIPFKMGSGAKTSKFITALIAWVRFKGIAGGLDKNIRNCAFAIARRMKIEGSPTRGAFKFTSNGRRIEWNDYVILTQMPYIENEVGTVADAYLANAFWSKIESITGKYTEFAL
jgi:hypothetical protein